MADSHNNSTKHDIGSSYRFHINMTVLSTHLVRILIYENKREVEDNIKKDNK